MVRGTTVSKSCAASLFVALCAAVLSAAAGAQQAWTCTGLGSAACAIQLSLQSPACPGSDQVCDGSADALSRTGVSNGCFCLSACTRSADCGAGEACIGALGGHCTSRFACNANRDCPNDATCTLGYCSKVASCSNSLDCPSGTPDCVRGACVALAPGQCSTDAQCNADPCAAPQRCDPTANRCVATGPRPCAGMAGAQCVQAGVNVQCMIPACTSDAQCSTDPCAGTPQRCNVATGRCEPGDKPCQDGSSFCMRVTNSPGLAYCAPGRPDPLAGDRLPVERIDPDDLEIIWSTDSSRAAGGGRDFRLRTWLPAAAVPAGARPGNLRVVIAGGDRGVVADTALAAPGRVPAWIQDTGTGAWRFGGTGGAGRLVTATMTPVAAQGGRVRIDLRGRTIAKAGLVDPAKAALAVHLAIEWAGASPGVKRGASEVVAVLDGCRTEGAGPRAAVVCVGRKAK